MAKIITAYLSDLMQQHLQGAISFSRMVELLNEKATEPVSNLDELRSAIPNHIAPKDIDIMFFRINILKYLNHDDMMFLRDWLNTYDKPKQPAKEALQSNVPSELQSFMDEIHQWADATFGTERTALAPLHHLRKEVDEAIEAMQTKSHVHITEELADCFILILNSSSKYGLTFNTLLSAAKRKMVKNKARQWGKPDENGVCEHIKEGNTQQKE